GWWPLFTLGDRFGVAAAVGLPLTRWRHGATRHAKSPTVASGALRFPLPSLWDALPVLYVAKAWPSGSQRPGGGRVVLADQGSGDGPCPSAAHSSVSSAGFSRRVRPASLAVGRPCGTGARRARVQQPLDRRGPERRHGWRYPRE